MPRAPPNQHLSSASTFSSTYSTLDNSTYCVFETRSKTRDVARAFVYSIGGVDNARRAYGNVIAQVMAASQQRERFMGGVFYDFRDGKGRGISLATSVEPARKSNSLVRCQVKRRHNYRQQRGSRVSRSVVYRVCLNSRYKL